MSYTPSSKMLDKYADVLIKCALNGGKGIKKGDVVLLQVPECAKAFLFALRKSVLKAGGNPLTQYLPDGDGRKSFARDFYQYASDTQLTFFPAQFLQGRIAQIDHSVGIIAEHNKYELKGIDPAKIMLTQKSMLPYKKWVETKENAGKYTWTLALYGTSAMAKDVGLSEKEYWKQIVKACYLDTKNPVQKWRSIMTQITSLQKKLNALPIDFLHVEAKETDLIVGIGPHRKWLGGTGRNIPSFELFISPDCRRTEGHIHFNQPLYHYGNRIQDISLEFKKGRVVKACAQQNEKLLKTMIAVQGADMIGEYSLTDGRMSRITKFMGETLYDENVGGPQGNTHLALGSAYKDSYPGNPAKVTPAQWKAWGFNESAIHTDIISTEKRKVTATLMDGSEKVIYKNGKFLV